jgi:tetratricopeptide (TPR) repeat protein
VSGPRPGPGEREAIARAVRQLGARSLDQAEAEIERGLAGHPRSAPLLALSAELNRKRGRLPEARALLRQAQAVDAFDPEVLQVAAEIAFDSGDYRRAAEAYRQVLSRKPSSYHASRLVRALHKLGEFGEAADTARQALERHPDDPWLLSGLAAAEARRSRHREAIALYERVLKLRPGDRFAYKELMRLRTAEAPPAEAAAALKGLVRTGERRKDPQLRTLAADRLRSAGQVAEAAAEYGAALELDPGNTYALSQLGFCYRRLGDAEKAMETLARAFLARPADPYVRKSLVSICREEGQLDRLLALIDEALRLHPDVKALYGVRKVVARTAAGTGTDGARRDGRDGAPKRDRRPPR